MCQDFAFLELISCCMDNFESIELPNLENHGMFVMHSRFLLFH